MISLEVRTKIYIVITINKQEDDTGRDDTCLLRIYQHKEQGGFEVSSTVVSVVTNWSVRSRII